MEIHVKICLIFISRIAYLKRTDNILVLFYTQIGYKNVILLAGFQYDLMAIQKWLTFYWAALCICWFVAQHARAFTISLQVLFAFMVGLHNLYWYYGSQTYYVKKNGVDKLAHTSEAFQG